MVLGLLLTACSSAEDGDDAPGGGARSTATPGGSGAAGTLGGGGVTGGAGAGSGASTSGGSGGATTTGTAGAGGSIAGGSGGSGGAGAGDGGSDLDAGTDAGTPDVTEGLIGWASEEGDGVPTTTGGAAGETVTANDASELLDYAASDEPLVIEVEGTYSVPRLEVASNKTIVGVGEGATINGGIRIRGDDSELVENVIIQNLTVNGATSDVDGDAVQIHYAHHVWVDHCEIFDGPDGNLDIVHMSSWVTVSWTEIHYTSDSAEHRFASLVGHSDDNADEDEDRLKVTYHHNFWADNIVERMPRVRFGQVHVFNNLYAADGNNYAIGGGVEASLLIEANRFEGVNDPHIFYDGEATAQIVANDNVYVGTSGAQDEGQGSAFDPPYDYTLDDADTIGDLIRDNAGPR